jgi:glutaminyl-peptide cyclotransferase
VDIIDFDYPHWHKLSDLPEHCSSETMAKVSRVLSVWVQRVR